MDNEITRVKRFVKPGDTVEQFQKICEVQSDKAAVEITSRYDGVVQELKYKVGDIAKVGSPLVEIEIENDDESSESKVDEADVKPPVNAPVSQTSQIQASAPANESALTMATPAVRRLAKENSVDLRKVKATGPQGRILKGDVLEYISNGGKLILNASGGVKLGFLGDFRPLFGRFLTCLVNSRIQANGGL
jgi:2-oxoisovalerate dehydrogenase E2 component (dihydrolipoyl transacylase)